jgi:hypothetical protein
MPIGKLYLQAVIVGGSIFCFNILQEGSIEKNQNYKIGFYIRLVFASMVLIIQLYNMLR